VPKGLKSVQGSKNVCHSKLLSTYR